MLKIKGKLLAAGLLRTAEIIDAEDPDQAKDIRAYAAKVAEEPDTTYKIVENGAKKAAEDDQK